MILIFTCDTGIYTPYWSGAEEGIQFRGLSSQQVKFSMVKIKSYGGVLE